jgi:large subunit ribosomal protein L31
MKESIHPKYHAVKVSCACGKSFETRSTAESLSLDICSNCHPFFTGKQKLLDSAGRVEKFNKRYNPSAKSEK